VCRPTSESRWPPVSGDVEPIIGAGVRVAGLDGSITSEEHAIEPDCGNEISRQVPFDACEPWSAPRPYCRRRSRGYRPAAATTGLSVGSSPNAAAMTTVRPRS
jgi:hypothetical protein